MKKLLLGVAVACIIGLTVENVLVSKSTKSILIYF